MWRPQAFCIRRDILWQAAHQVMRGVEQKTWTKLEDMGALASCLQPRSFKLDDIRDKTRRLVILWRDHQDPARGKQLVPSHKCKSSKKLSWWDRTVMEVTETPWIPCIAQMPPEQRGIVYGSMVVDAWHLSHIGESVGIILAEITLKEWCTHP